MDSTYAKDDLGTVLLALSVKSCVEDPAIKAFDLMGGGAAYKGMWARSGNHQRGERDDPGQLARRLLASREGFSNASRMAYRALTPNWLRSLPTGSDSQAAAGPRTGRRPS